MQWKKFSDEFPKDTGRGFILYCDLKYMVLAFVEGDKIRAFDYCNDKCDREKIFCYLQIEPDFYWCEVQIPPRPNS